MGGWSSDLQLSALPTHCAARAIVVGWMLPALPGAWQSSASSSWGHCPRERPTTAKPSRGARPWIKRFYSFNPQQPMSRIWFITISFLLVLGPRSLRSREVRYLAQGHVGSDRTSIQAWGSLIPHSAFLTLNFTFCRIIQYLSRCGLQPKILFHPHLYVSAFC